MSSMQEDIQCAGSDTRPPMLDRTDFESWQQRIRLYCLGKDNGENIMKSIKEGPFHMGTVSDVIAGGTEGAVQQGPVRARVLNDLSAEEKERYKADIRATNILLQGIPKDIYSLINHYTDAKDIWENMKMILEGSELTKDDRESQLYDEFEHFRQNKGETIQGYYVRFTKLINDMRNIKMTMPRMQLNSKFVNNMLPEWSRFITEVKLNRGLKESNFDQLYAYLKQHEVHANENRIMMERFIQPNNDPLALVSDASVQQYPTQPSKSPQPSKEPYPTDNSQLDSGSSSTENLIESLSNTLALLTQSYKSHLPQTNNQLRASSNARNKAMVQDGKVVVQDVRGRYNATNQGRPFQRNNARGNGVAGNVGGQNRGGMINPGQAKPIKHKYAVSSLMDMAYRMSEHCEPVESYKGFFKSAIVTPSQYVVRSSLDDPNGVKGNLRQYGIRQLENLRFFSVSSRIESKSRAFPPSLNDLLMRGRLFTRMNKACTKLSNIDPFPILENVLEAHTNAHVSILNKMWSNHNPILLYCKKVDFGPISFKGFHSWFERKDFDDIVNESWVKLSMGEDDSLRWLHDKLKGLKQYLKQWYSRVKDYEHSRKKEILLSLIYLKQKIDAGCAINEDRMLHINRLQDLDDVEKLEAMDLV
ncbi:hypothetical protein Tco_0483856 [Tanacetum coccineum]